MKKTDKPNFRKWGDGMRLIDADELCEGRVENDPVRIAAMCAPTIEAVPVENIKRIVERLEEVKTKGYVTGITANPYEFGACHAMDDAIQIVRKEGGL